MKKKLFFAAVVVFTLSFAACGGNNSGTPQRLVTIEAMTPTLVAASATPDSDVYQTEACHRGQILSKVYPEEIIYEDSDICLVFHPSVPVYEAYILGAQNIEEYRKLKERAEVQIFAKIKDQACRVIWITDLFDQETTQDLWTSGCAPDGK